VSSLELRRVCETGLLLLAGTVPEAEVLVSFSYQLVKLLISCNIIMTIRYNYHYHYHWVCL
jgi:hypothetical protein